MLPRKAAIETWRAGSQLRPGASQMTNSLPTLWHLSVSHYSEKTRWALDYKQVPHVRRAVAVPGAHIPAALWMTRGEQITFPVLTMDGRHIGDSTTIIAELERRFPEPPLYPPDPEERRRAIELEDYFDEQLGPAIRLLAFHELGNDPERFEAVIKRTAPEALARRPGPAAAYARVFTALRFGARDEQGAERARAEVAAALDRLDAELEACGGDYLAGDTFTVADLTAASLFYPLVLPDEGPVPSDEPAPKGLQRFRESLKERRGFKWVADMFHRHRRPAAAKS